MNTPEKLVLIDGNFEQEEAKSILMNIFSSKIQFHELKNFSVQERTGRDDSTAVKRIPELKKSIELLQNFLEDAKHHNKKLRVKSEVSISFVDE